MDHVSEALLKKMGVSVFGFSRIDNPGGGPPSSAYFEQCHDKAFEDDGVPSVVVGISSGYVLIVSSARQLWEEMRASHHRAIQQVLRIPKGIWDEVVPTLIGPENIHDLTKVPA